MKRGIGIIFLLMSLAVSSQETGKPTPSQIREVTVFQNGAVVERKAEAGLEPGVNYILFSGLSTQLQVPTLEVKALGNASVLSVTLQADSLKVPEKQKELKAWTDSLRALQQSMNRLNVRQKGLLAEDDLLKQNRQLGGANVGLKVADLKEAAQFFRQRSAEIAEGLVDIDEKKKELTNLIHLVSERVRLLKPQSIRPANAVLVMVESLKKQNMGFELSYFVPNCSWTPLYDIRATDIIHPVELGFKANVQQFTDEDWKNVRLVLSTGNPMANSVAPVLYPWYLDFWNPPVKTQMRGAYSDAPSMARTPMAQDMGAKEKFSEVVVVESQTRIQYEIPVNYSIASGGKPIIVEIWKKELPADFEYFSIPKLDPGVYLKARIRGWDELNLMPGQMSVFFENSFVGESSLSLGELSDTLDISLGKDASISVLRERIKDYKETNLIGTNLKKTEGWEITVRNSKKQAVDIRILDQVPLSANEAITVEILELSKGSHDAGTGEVVWKWKLGPSETKKTKLIYSIRYPKNKKIR